MRLEFTYESLPPLLQNGQLDLGNKGLVKGKVVPSQEHRRDDLARFNNMVEISPTELAARRTATVCIKRLGILGMSCIAQVQGT